MTNFGVLANLCFMKTLLTIFTLVFTVMFSSTSFAGWTKVTVSLKGNTFYVDFRRIKKDRGYVYWWEMQNLLKPDKDGDLSYKYYSQSDCKLFRYKVLSNTYHTQPMGEGTPSTSSNKPDKEWRYPTPNSAMEIVLKKVCSR